VPPRDPAALADAIVSLLDDPETCRRMGEQGYVKLKTDMAWSTIAESLLAVYDELAPTPRTTGNLLQGKLLAGQ